MSYAIAAATEFLDSWLGHQVARGDITGLSVAVLHKEHIVFSKAYGWADAMNHEPLTVNHVFNIGSLAKMMTATTIMQLVQQGKLSLDDRAVRHLPWLARHQDTRVTGITIGQLLTHRAGLVRDGASAWHWQLEAPFPDTKELRRTILGSDIVLDNYEKFKYSNLGYGLLGQIVEAVSNQSYAEFAIQHIIKPLALQHTFIDYDPSRDSQIAVGHTRRLWGKRHVVPRAIPARSLTSAAGWYASPADVCRFMASYMSEDAVLLAQQSKRDLQASTHSHWVPAVKRGTEYSSGFMSYLLDDRRLVGHGGGFAGHCSYAFYDPIDQLGVVVLSNAKDAPIRAVAHGIFNILDYFFKYASGPTPSDYAKFNVQLMNIWVSAALVATDQRIVAVRMDDWLPFKQVQELTPLSPTTLKITKANDVASEGELVTFVYKDKQLQHVNYAGQILRPEKMYTDWLAIHLPKVI